MTMTIPRAAFGVFSLLFTVATIDVSRAMAQTTGITPTACAMGTIAFCGTQPTSTCANSFSFNFNVLMQSGGFSFTQSNCTSGVKNLYKDVRTPTTTTTAPAGPYKTCGATTTSGSSDDGFETKSGDFEASIELCEM